jgi:hypothetical protein
MSKETFYEEPTVLDTLVAFDEDRVTKQLIINRTQEIPEDFLEQNKRIREGTALDRSGNFMPVASIPVEVADWLLRELNYDVTKEPFKRTVAMLKSQGLDAFVLTNKSL